MARLVVVGSSNTDLVVQAPRFPRPGESVLGGVFGTFAGGKGANQAVAAARAGADVTFIGAIGDDAFGRKAKEGLEAEGLDLTHLLVVPGVASGVALIIVDAGGENEIVVAEGANLALSKQQIDQATDIIEQCDAVLCQLEMPIEVVSYLADVVEQMGKTFVLNPAPAQAVPESVFPSVDVLTPNLLELESLSGGPLETLDEVEAAAKSFLRRGVGAVVVTQGRDGSLVVTPEESWWTAALPVDARDTVGAGDCFSACLTVALAEGQTLRESIRFATVAAGLSVTRLGAQPSMPRREEILGVLAEQGK